MSPVDRPYVAIVLVIAFIQALCLTTGIAAKTYLKREGGRHFPLARCLGIAAIPSTLTIIIPVGLAWTGLDKGLAFVIGAFLLSLSMMTIDKIERWVAGLRHGAKSKTADYFDDLA